MSFSQRHAPPPRALGPEIPAGVRQAISSWFHERGVDDRDVRQIFFQRRGYGHAFDVVADVRDRWGEDAEALLHRDLRDHPGMDTIHFSGNRRVAASRVIHLYMPEALYLDYVEFAVVRYAEERAISAIDSLEGVMEDPAAPVRYLNELFAGRRIDYRFNDEGRAEWHGDEGAYHEVIRPALDAVGDQRLAACGQEFESALGHLRAGTAKDREDAIEEAAKAVESAMKVVLAAQSIARTGNETAEPLWNLLRENEVVPPKTKDALLAPSRLRNEYGGHGQGEEVREIPDGVPELAVRTAAAAIAYLGSRLS